MLKQLFKIPDLTTISSNYEIYIGDIVTDLNCSISQNYCGIVLKEKFSKNKRKLLVEWINVDGTSKKSKKSVQWIDEDRVILATHSSKC